MQEKVFQQKQRLRARVSPQPIDNCKINYMPYFRIVLIKYSEIKNNLLLFGDQF